MHNYVHAYSVLQSIPSCLVSGIDHTAVTDHEVNAVNITARIKEVGKWMITKLEGEKRGGGGGGGGGGEGEGKKGRGEKRGGRKRKEEREEMSLGK